jgi:hypothetical protein
VIVVIAGLVAFGVLLVATWDEGNQWKVAALYVTMFAALWVLKAEVRSESYLKGYEDGICFVTTSIDKLEGITLKYIPEFC